MTETPSDQPATVMPPPARKPTLRGHLLRAGRNLVLIYLGVCIGMWWLQDWMIFPGASSQGLRTAQVPEATWYERIKLTTADGDTTWAVFGPALDENRRPLADAASRPTLLVFYGNGDHLANALYLFSYFRRLGANVMVTEYVGYGMATGRASERAFYATADAAWAHLAARTDIDPRRIVATGISIGCAPAIDLAARKPAAAVICFTPFTSMTAMGRHVVPWLPTSLMLRSRFDNQSKLATNRVPTFITHGRRDRTVPYFMSEQLRASAGGPVTFHSVEDGDHNDIFEAGGDELTEALRAFIAAVPPHSGS